jgi:hypothetical protein
MIKTLLRTALIGTGDLSWLQTLSMDADSPCRGHRTGEHLYLCLLARLAAVQQLLAG